MHEGVPVIASYFSILFSRLTIEGKYEKLEDKLSRVLLYALRAYFASWSWKIRNRIIWHGLILL